IGTFLTASIPGYRALNVVMKPLHVNGRPVAKISDAPGKSICDDTGFLAYLRSVYNVDEPSPPVQFSEPVARIREQFYQSIEAQR
ncbi:MAG TPA: hypothetical protein VIM69_03420, partial [Opitutaceae bacterium]